VKDNFRLKSAFLWRGGIVDMLNLLSSHEKKNPLFFGPWLWSYFLVCSKLAGGVEFGLVLHDSLPDHFEIPLTTY
jgi:hypothetical protein